jgi:hypothetical protein
LTESGHARSPDRHGDLTVQLIRNVQSVFGDEALERLIAVREGSAETAYRKALDGIEGIAERLAALAQLRADEGYMASAEPQTDNTFSPCPETRQYAHPVFFNSVHFIWRRIQFLAIFKRAWYVAARASSRPSSRPSIKPSP